MSARITEATNRIETIAHRWAHAAYCKALGKPFEDIDAIKKELHAALAAALSTEPGEAEGMVLVPREPNDAMAKAGCRAIQDWEDWDTDGIVMDFRWLACWKAMIAAAPLPEDTLGEQAM